MNTLRSVLTTSKRKNMCQNKKYKDKNSLLASPLLKLSEKKVKDNKSATMTIL